MTRQLLRSTVWLPHVGGQSPHSDVEPARRTLLSLIRLADWQQRPRLTAHPILMDVAQARAEYIANVPDIRAVQSDHTFGDGLPSPNQWAREAGYPLPDWYPAGNSIESFATGYRDRDGTILGSAALDAWLDSPKHRAHVAGEGSFFGAQVYAGVGVTFTGRYKPAWVFISAP